MTTLIEELPTETETETEATVSHETIANRAFEIYLARGGRDGSDLEDWLRAEAELTSDSRGE